MSTRFLTVVLPIFYICFVRYLSLALNNTNVVIVDRIGLVGAIPVKDLIYKTVIACEGQKLFIECPSIYNRIQVHATFYGREDAKTCKHPELPSDKICADQNATVKNVVTDLCQGEEKCEISATNDFLAHQGTIICPNVYKYLYVKYRCVPRTSIPDAPSISPEDRVSSVTSAVTTNYAPVQCCYVVPSSVGTTQTASRVGGTIIRHSQGVQSVEERIVSEIPQGTISGHTIQISDTRPAVIPNQRIPITIPVTIPYQKITVTKPAIRPVQQITITKPTATIKPARQVSFTKPGIGSDQQIPVTNPRKVTDVIQKPTTQLPNIPIARIHLPGISKLELSTLIKDGGKEHEIKLESPQLRSIIGEQKTGDGIGPYLFPRNKAQFVASTQREVAKTSGKGKHPISVVSPLIRKNIWGLQKKSDVIRSYLLSKQKNFLRTKRKIIKNNIGRIEVTK
ncbi:uncharacterized protein LOC114521068 isoform X2 [Dendronephthya gigantea]|uniref:uncharacterized protein LOC114521068 isoform X2 n=1 Tax=Dendronephthya gigantea TaxID=151771 RepID=UPI00106D9E88|nr:uncharacterized protein LOC114521068 isoform X2 [Dendronephthya gigantea]